MTEYSNMNSGAIFVNPKKTSEKHPDRTGSLNVDGVDYWVSGWLKKDKKGNPFMSLAVKAKEERPRQSSDPTRKAKPQDDDFGNSDIPF